MVSANEIDALIPMDVSIPSNTVVPLVVISAGGNTPYNLRLTRNAPAIFTQFDDDGIPFVPLFDANFHAINIVRPGDTIIFYAAGLGPTDSSGRLTDNLDVYIGERKAQVLFAGLAPGLPGVYQVNVFAPAPATNRLYLQVGGWQSNIVDIAIPIGSNTANIKGTIDGLNPSSEPAFPFGPCAVNAPFSSCGKESFSIMLHAGTFSVSFDILPSAGTFDVAAVGEAGCAIITIDPKAGAYSASVTTVTAAARAGDFSSSIVPLWDYFSCTLNAVCFSFPGPSVLPLSRLDPYWARASQML